MKRRKRSGPSSSASAADFSANSTRSSRRNFAQPPRKHDTAAPTRQASRRPTLLAAGLIALATAAAYHNSFRGPFVYDDLRAIAENPTIRRLWPIGPVLSPPPSGVTVAGRPLLNLSLAMNYALSGLNVWSYHATNLLIHIAAALLLFGIVRRTFLMPALRDRCGKAACWLALASTLIWTVHPLQTESVTYIVQRAESLAGLFCLLTLYGVIRGVWSAGVPPAHEDAGETPALRSRRPWLWYAVAVSACLLGMATKEVMVTAPLIVLLYDRTFLAGSWKEAWRQRWGLYVGLAATWALLAYLVLSAGLIGRRVEVGAPDWLSYARSQPSVILHYLRLAVWPSRLCLHYDWPVAHDLWAILPGAMVLAVLLAAAVWGLWKRTAYGFFAAWFLLTLAPTSSILPLGQLAAEHRMYLPLAAVTTLAIAGAYILWEKLDKGTGLFCRTGPEGASHQRAPSPFSWAAPAGVLALVLLALGSATVRRNLDYQSPLAIWQDTVAKDPTNAFAHANLAAAWDEAGNTAEAIRHFREALRLKPHLAEIHNNLGIVLANLGRLDEAMEHYRQALRLKPGFAQAHRALADALAGLGSSQQAIEHYRQALRLEPGSAETHNNLGIALLRSGQPQQAIAQFDEALRINPSFVEAHNNLGNVLTVVGRPAEAIEHCERALQLQPDHPLAHCNLANAMVAVGRSGEAIEHYRRALRLKPDYAEAKAKLNEVLEEKKLRP